MEASSVLSSSSASFNSRETRFDFPKVSFAASPSFCYVTSFRKWPRLLFSCPCPCPRTSPLTIAQVVENPTLDSLIATTCNSKDMLPKIDKSGRFCSPRAARELALMILYAACLDGSDPVRLFEKRLNARRETGYEFDKAYLMEYNHMSFGGPPVTTETPEEADEILRNDQKESDIEAEVLSAPPKLVYSKLVLRFTRKLLVAVAEKWDSNVLAIDKVAPHNWKNEPAGRILEFSVLHLAMSEMAVLGTRHQIVINEAVDLAKRFCDGAAPRIINGCLRNFLKELKENGEAENVEIKQTV
ncbi:UNVERIFIED_CONTAM: Transcription antitermination protein NusB [Sesamum calycinum]|uniref:Transcription antitermination protein NusB n=3 Tax=Sesamum TaxID=4181 RepID=A0AAW2SBK1_9LAMI